MKFQAAQLYNLTCTNFKAKAIKLPTDWSQPSGDPDGKQYPDAFKITERMVPPGVNMLFLAASTNKYHVDAQKRLHSDFDKYIDGITKAICAAQGQWQDAAMFTVGIINGPSCNITPASLQGPPLGPLILANNPPMATPQEIKYTNAIANAIGTAWQAWQLGVMGTLMYPPTFAFMTSPVHPPTPNIPLPIAAMSSSGESMLSGSSLKGLMVSNLGDPQALHHADLFDSLGNAFNTVFTSWKPATMITGLNGTGPIPSFAPPYVPGGPVAGGAVIPCPCLK
ncbi:MAG: hypothetical protein RBU45_10295 [Myxococcota bacterium]|jgi:hypothetical protein|nr:hypothetical protein [Myxococcota bacterium]